MTEVGNKAEIGQVVVTYSEDHLTEADLNKDISEAETSEEGVISKKEQRTFQ